MDEPGGLRELGEAGRAAWASTVSRCLRSVLPPGKTHPYLQEVPDGETPALSGPDWTGLPARVVACLGRRAALASLDPRRDLQEEYLEWRVVRGSNGRIQRVEMTTELRDLWRVLAAHEPERIVELTGELVGSPV